jgi:hypothetical protein
MMRPPRLAPRLAALALLFPLAAMGQLAPPPGEPSPAAEPAAPAPPATEAPPPAAALLGPVREPPRWRLGVTFGAGTSYGASYVMFGGLIGYDLGLGFELCLDAQYWGGANPHLGKVAPGVNWYAPIPYRPYVGLYYARWIIGGAPDQDALGGRFGVTIVSTPVAAFGAGMAYEKRFECTTQCDAFWPELTFAFRF